MAAGLARNVLVKPLKNSLASCEVSFSKPATNVAPRRILVVDDEKHVCDAIRMLLEFDKHQVVTTSNGAHALELLAAGTFDVVFIDYLMPGMRGDELARKIKEAVPGQPVVMITAYAEVLQSSRKPLPHVDYLVPKPFLLENLRQAIAAASGEPKLSSSTGGDLS